MITIAYAIITIIITFIITMKYFLTEVSKRDLAELLINHDSFRLVRFIEPPEFMRSFEANVLTPEQDALCMYGSGVD